MGIVEVLTIIFVVLKCCGILKWSWLTVFLPEIIALAVYAVFTVVCLIVIKRKERKRKQELFARMDEMFELSMRDMEDFTWKR